MDTETIVKDHRLQDTAKKELITLTVSKMAGSEAFAHSRSLNKPIAKNRL